jgi:hypothetical protein
MNHLNTPVRKYSGMPFGLFGDDDDSETDTQPEQTGLIDAPFSMELINSVESQEDLRDDDLDLAALAEAVQKWVDSNEYVDQQPADGANLPEDAANEVTVKVGQGSRGNLFLDWLYSVCQRRNLIKIKAVEPGELYLVVPEEVWAFVTEDLKFETSEARALMHLHNEKASSVGYAAAAGGLNTMVIETETDILRDFAALSELDDENVNLEAP